MRFKRAALGIVVLLLLLVSIAIAAKYMLRERVIVGQAAAESARVSIDSIDHRAWDTLLKKYVKGEGLVDYSAWHASPSDRQALEQYLGTLSQADVTIEHSREAELAFWINAYNALTIQGILREYPTDSIRNFTPRFWGYHIWHDLLLPVGDETVSLDDIEHERLRPMGDFRIHFAIVCASRGCPPLRNEAYTTEQVDEQLTDQAKRFMNDPRNFRRLVEEGRTFIAWSPLLVWYGDDLGPDRATRMHRLAKWVDDDDTKKAAIDPDTFVRRNEYDWSLNDTSQPAPSSVIAQPEGETEAASDEADADAGGAVDTDAATPTE